jgi:hypothetical protein
VASVSGCTDCTLTQRLPLMHAWQAACVAQHRREANRQTQRHRARGVMRTSLHVCTAQTSFVQLQCQPDQHEHDLAHLFRAPSSSCQCLLVRTLVTGSTWHLPLASSSLTTSVWPLAEATCRGRSCVTSSPSCSRAAAVLSMSSSMQIQGKSEPTAASLQCNARCGTRSPAKSRADSRVHTLPWACATY